MKQELKVLPPGYDTMHTKATTSEEHIAKVTDTKNALNANFPCHDGKPLVSSISAISSRQSESSSNGNGGNQNRHQGEVLAVYV